MVHRNPLLKSPVWANCSNLCFSRLANQKQIPQKQLVTDIAWLLGNSVGYGENVNGKQNGREH